MQPPFLARHKCFECGPWISSIPQRLARNASSLKRPHPPAQLPNQNLQGWGPRVTGSQELQVIPINTQVWEPLSKEQKDLWLALVYHRMLSSHPGIEGCWAVGLAQPHIPKYLLPCNPKWIHTVSNVPRGHRWWWNCWHRLWKSGPWL